MQQINGTGVKDSYEPPCVCWESNLCLLQDPFLFQSHISGHHLLIVVFNYMYMCVFECRFVHMTTVPMEARRGYWVPGPGVTVSLL